MFQTEDILLKFISSIYLHICTYLYFKVLRDYLATILQYVFTSLELIIFMGNLYLFCGLNLTYYLLAGIIRRIMFDVTLVYKMLN
jgi:hypothetical protein